MRRGAMNLFFSPPKTISSMAPKWNYFVSIAGILEGEPSLDVPVNENTPLCLRDDNTIVAWGTPLHWTKPKMVVELLRNAGQRYRMRLCITDKGYGFHIDTHCTLFNEALGSPEPFAGEVSLSRIFNYWEHYMFRRNFDVISCPLTRDYSRRKCRRRLTLWQQQALSWMQQLGESAGLCTRVHTGLLPPHCNYVFSMTHRMFVPITHHPTNTITITGGVLTGARGSGKTYIVKNLLKTVSSVTNRRVLWGKYTYNATLIVVPPHLLDHWHQELLDLPGGVELVASPKMAREWRVTNSRARVVIVTYFALRTLIRKSTKTYAETIDAIIQLRKGTCEPTLSNMVWDRIIYDESLINTVNRSMLSRMHTHFTWMLQGDASELDERHLVETLYRDKDTLGEIMEHVCFNKLPALMAHPTLHITSEELQACEMQRQTYRAVKNATDSHWGVYAHPTIHVFSMHTSWDEVLLVAETQIRKMENAVATAATGEEEKEDEGGEEENEDEDEEEYEDEDEDEDEDGEIDDEDDSDWEIESVFEEDLASAHAWNLSITLNGMEIENISVQDVVDDGQVDTVVPSFTYFAAQLNVLKDSTTDSSICGVCMEHDCDIIALCGHTTCFQCAVYIMENGPPRCPHCRYVLKKEQVYMIQTPFTPVAHQWLRAHLRDATSSTLVVGEDAEGLRHLSAIFKDMPHISLFHSTNLVGKPLPNVNHVVMLDDAKIPSGLDHPSGVVHVTRLRVKLEDPSPPTTASPSIEIN